MSGETNISYGSVLIRNCHTQSITQTPVLDPSGTDLMYYKFVVKVTGIVHGRASWCQYATPVAGANPSGLSGVDAMIGVRVGLPPRQEFVMQVGYQTSPPTGSTLLQASPIRTGVIPNTLTNKDVKNGPYCTEFVVSKIVGGDIYAVEATFEIHKLECTFNGQAEGNTKGVLSNRWSAVDSIDQHRRLARTYSGTLVLASNVYNPNMFRGMLVPPLQPRMRRENISFTISEDGLNLRYTFTDVQVSQAAPHPCTHWEINVSNVGNLAMVTRREISGTLVCPDTSTAADLLSLAYYIIAAKVYGFTFAEAKANGITNRAILDSIAFTEHIGEKTAISFSASYIIQQTVANAVPEVDFAGRLQGYIGQPMTDSLLPESARPYSPYQSDGGRPSNVNASGIENPYVEGPVPLASMFLTYLQSACDNNHNLISDPLGDLPTDTNRTSDSGPTASVPVYTSPTLPAEDTSYFTENAKTYAYTAWKMSSTIRNDQLKAAMPIAKQAVGTSGPPVDSTKVVKLSLPQARRIVRIEAERVGKWPEMPDLETLAGFSESNAGAGYAGPTQHLLETKQLYALPVVAATGQEVFTVGIEATYALTRAPKPEEFIPVGRSIWNTDGAKFTTIEATKAPAWSS